MGGGNDSVCPCCVARQEEKKELLRTVEEVDQEVESIRQRHKANREAKEKKEEKDEVTTLDAAFVQGVERLLARISNCRVSCKECNQACLCSGKDVFCIPCAQKIDLVIKEVLAKCDRSVRKVLERSSVLVAIAKQINLSYDQRDVGVLLVRAFLVTVLFSVPVLLFGCCAWLLFTQDRVVLVALVLYSSRTISI